MIYIKSQSDIVLIKKACEIWKKVREEIIKNTKVGVSLIELDNLAKKIIDDNGGEPSFYQYNGFPGNICISVNDQLIHGIPSNYKLKKDDLVTFDVGVTYQNHYCDSAFTVNLNPNNSATAKIDKVTRMCLKNAIKQAKGGNTIGDISSAIEEVATQNGFEVNKDYGGHGCGNKIHEDPIILCHGEKHTGKKIINGMVLCIEPMLMTGTDEYYVDPKNNWTVIAKNHKLTCHWEHMVWINGDETVVLTA